MAHSEIRFRRNVPAYARIPGLVLGTSCVKFRSDVAGFVRGLVKWCLGLLFGRSTHMKELYEEPSFRLVPCYEIRFLLRVEMGERALPEL
jgi:hypothetical protein